MLQVDQLLWPDVWQRLHNSAAGPLAQLTDGLKTIVARGQKVLGFGSCDTEEGVTTLVWVAARRLAAQGLKVAMVDANLASPKLAASLGLFAQVGWEETLGGQVPLEEVAVESIGDSLTLVPLREPPANPGEMLVGQQQMAANFAILAENYDAVLVDLGPLEGEEASTGAMGPGVRHGINAVVLVHNVRSTTPNRIEDLQKNLAAAGIVHAGTIQNFVAG